MTGPAAFELVQPIGHTPDTLHGNTVGTAFAGAAGPAQADQEAASRCESAGAGQDPAASKETFNPGLSSMRQVAEVGWLDCRLSELGAEILTEPIPDFLLRALSQLPNASDRCA